MQTRGRCRAARRRRRDDRARRGCAPSYARHARGLARAAARRRARVTLELAAARRGRRRAVAVERALEIVATAAGAQPAALEPRPLPRAAALRAGAGARRAGCGVRPSALFVRVAGGACVPERECRLFVHVGEPAAAVRVVATPSVTPVPASAHGLCSDQRRRRAARDHARARRRELAHRGRARRRRMVADARVPAADRARRQRAARDRPRCCRLAPRRRSASRATSAGCIVDAFLEQRWRATGSLRDCRGAGPPAVRSARVRAVARCSCGAIRSRRRAPRVATRVRARTRSRATPPCLRAPRAGRARARTGRRARAAGPGCAGRVHRTTAARRRVTCSPRSTAALFAAAAADLGVPARARAARGRRARACAGSRCSCSRCARSRSACSSRSAGFAAAGEAGRVMAQAGEVPQRVDRQRLRMAAARARHGQQPALGVRRDRGLRDRPRRRALSCARPMTIACVFATIGPLARPFGRA